MPRFAPNPRNANERAALELCLQHILEVHHDTPGYIHVWQPLKNEANQFVLATLPDFITKFIEKPWMFENGLPIDL